MKRTTQVFLQYFFLIPAFVFFAGACTNIQEPLDISGPALTTQPPNGATDVPLDTAISATFHPDIEIDQDTLTQSNVWLLRDGVSPRNITINFDKNTNQLLIDHELLEEGMSYTVALTNYITSEDGQPLGALLRSTEPASSIDETPEEGETATETSQAPTLAPRSIGTMSALAHNGGAQLVNAVANTAYAWTFTTMTPQAAEGAETEPETTDTTLPPQPDGSACSDDIECISRVCSTGTCQAPTCGDQKKNGDETDNDCGGPTCTDKCEIGKLCLADGDCLSNVCDSGSGTCAVPDDNSVADGAFCLEDIQCISGRCDSTLNECLEATCEDQIQNQGETDQDCGGPCDGCGIGGTCQEHADCLSEICHPDEDRCVELLDGTVEDDGFCTENAHCISGVCAGDVCHQATCTDGIKNGNESDVDCGPGCPKCQIGDFCVSTDDCQHSVCENGTCVEPHDLGDGEACSENAQCKSGVCWEGSCAMIKRWGEAVKLGDEGYDYDYPVLGIAGVGANRDGFSVHQKDFVDPANRNDISDRKNEVMTAPGCSSFFAARSRTNPTTFKRPVAAHNRNGQAVVAWAEEETRSNESPNEIEHIYARHFTSGVNSNAHEIKIFPYNMTVTDSLQKLDVAMNDEGNAFLAWQVFRGSPSDREYLWSGWYDQASGQWIRVHLHYWARTWSDELSPSQTRISEAEFLGDANQPRVAVSNDNKGMIVWPQKLNGDINRTVLQGFLHDPSHPLGSAQLFEFAGALDEGSGWGNSSDVEMIYDRKNNEFIAVWLQVKTSINRKVLRWAKTSNHRWQSPQEVVDSQQRGQDVTDSEPSLAIDDAGNWIVAWKVRGPALQGIMARRYLDSSNNWDGPPAGISIAENSGSTDLVNPTVVMNQTTGEAMIVYKFQKSHVGEHSLIARSYNTWTGWETGLGQVISPPTNYIDDDFAALYDGETDRAVVVWAQKPVGLSGGLAPHLLYVNSFHLRPTP